jgi:hypothetical protein
MQQVTHWPVLLLVHPSVLYVRFTVLQCFNTFVFHVLTPVESHEAFVLCCLPWCLQMTSSGPTFCGAVGLCWQPVQRVCVSAMTWCGWTWAQAQG